MRTTVRMDDALLREAKKAALESGRSLTAFLEDAVREVLARRRRTRRPPVLEPVTGSGGLQPGVDLDDSRALRALLDEGLPLDKRR